MRIAVVGAASTYTPELLEGLRRLAGEAAVDRVALHDVDEPRLEVVAGAAERIARAHGYGGEVLSTTHLERAVEGADFVLVQIRVGGQAARRVDETVPLRCGCVGQETTGAGGFSKALRTVPVVLDIADRVRSHAADGAWIVDFTNPVGIVTRALLDAGHRAVGLCNVAIGFQRLFAEWLGVMPESVRLGHAGLNHLTWIRSVAVDGGEDQLPELIDNHGDELAEHLEMPRRILDLLGAVPSYYLRYFYEHDVVVASMAKRRSRAEEVAEVERGLLELYRDPALRDKPALLMERGGAYYSEAALQLVASLCDRDGAVHVVNVRNGDTIGSLPPDAVVEVPAQVSTDGVRAVPVPPLPPHQAGLTSHVAAYEELTLRAALTGDRDLAVEALLSHPLVGQSGPAERLVDDLLAAQRRHLPQFA